MGGGTVPRMTSHPLDPRDPDRIEGVLATIKSVWSADSDLRLTQLIVNAAKLAGRDVVAPELFSLEDDDLLVGLEAYQRLPGT